VGHTVHLEAEGEWLESVRGWTGSAVDGTEGVAGGRMMAGTPPTVLPVNNEPRC